MNWGDRDSPSTVRATLVIVCFLRSVPEEPRLGCTVVTDNNGGNYG